MLDLIRARLGQGARTLAFPKGEASLPERFRGLPVVEPAPGAPPFDVGACLFSPEEAGEHATGSVRFTNEFRMAASTRDALVSPTGQVRLADALTLETRRLFGRSLRLRSVVAGSCGGCEAELNALGNVVFDLARFGVQFVASPRHADGLVITGVTNRNMREALLRTYEATPTPRIVIAVGACAIAGGPFAGSPAIAETAGIPVDLYVPGCPPHPLTLLDGLLRLLGRLPADRLAARE
jgi:Ni,Fe-hydrogenase III small subunit